MLANHSPGPRSSLASFCCPPHILPRLPPSTCSGHHIWRNTAVVTNIISSSQLAAALWSSRSQNCMAIARTIMSTICNILHEILLEDLPAVISVPSTFRFYSLHFFTFMAVIDGNNSPGQIPSENSGKCRENMLAAPFLLSAAIL